MCEKYVEAMNKTIKIKFYLQDFTKISTLWNKRTLEV